MKASDITEITSPFITTDYAFKLAYRHIHASAMEAMKAGNTPEALAKHREFYKAVKHWLHSHHSPEDIKAAAGRFLAMMPK